MMDRKHCVVITAYKDVNMLRCLLSVLHKRMLCFVHIDQKSKERFRQLELDFPDVYFQSNFRITWGGIEHLKAILQMLDKSMKFDYKYVHIISGEDYPLKTLDEIEAYFENDDKIYTNYSFIDTKKHPGAKRYRYYWPYVKHSMNYKKQYIRIFNLFFVVLQMFFPFWNKNKIGEISKIYWGFVWGSYPKIAVEYVLNYLNIHQEFWKDLMTCKIPEELCFQTILMNSEFKNKMENNHLRYWIFRGSNSSGPVYLKIEDTASIPSDAIFARKVKYDSQVRQILEKRLKTDIK